MQRLGFCFLLAMLAQVSILLPAGLGQECPSEALDHRSLSYPGYAIERIRVAHSSDTPVIVSQGELDSLIDTEGGGACPISAALIAMQTLRSMAGTPLERHPYRFAIRLFQERPELKQGRITNDGFVHLLNSVMKETDGLSIQTETTSAKNSTHAASGPSWSGIDGPNLNLVPGQLKILAYTVSTPDGSVLGRHFVLLKDSGKRFMRVVNPSRPLKDYQFQITGVENHKERVFLTSPGHEDQPTLELNTIFTIQLKLESKKESHRISLSVDQVKTRIDLLASSLEKEGKLSSPRAWRKRGAEFGLPGLDLPTKVGGSGWNSQRTLEIFRHAGRYNLNLRDVVGGAHGRPITDMESPLAKSALQDLVSGNAYFAVAITERDAGTDTKSMRSRSVKEGDGYRLSGSKLWNARFRQATHVVLYTKAASGKPGDRTAFLLPMNHPGLEIVDRYAHGLTGNSFGGLEFENMYVGPEHLVGKDGDGSVLFKKHFLYWRLMQAGAAIGCGERALEIMSDRIGQRQVFGGPIGRFTHLQQPIGEYHTKLRMALALAREAARLIDHENFDAAVPLVNGVKAEGVEVALAACDAAMRAHGALGYSREVDLGDRVRDLMGLRIADGTTDVMRMTVVREAYGYDLWGMAVQGH